jgi:hypothetical protein
MVATDPEGMVLDNLMPFDDGINDARARSDL